MIPWMPSGIAISAPSASSQVSPRTTSRSRSRNIRTNSSAKSGFPPAASTIGRCTSAGRRVVPRSSPTSAAVSSPERGARFRASALGSSPPQLGLRSENSGRAVQTRSIGTASGRPATCSTNSRSAGSAQWTSSNTKTAPPEPASASRNRLHAVNDSSRSAVLEGSTPTSGAKRALTHSSSPDSKGTRRSARSSFASRPSGRVGLEDACLGLHDLAQGPERDAFAVGQAPPLAPDHRLLTAMDELEELMDHPALADTRFAEDRDELAGTVADRPVQQAFEERPLGITSDEGDLVSTGDVGPEPGASGERPPRRHGSGLPLGRDRLERLVVEDVLRRQVGELADRDPPSRRAGLQTSGGVDDVTRDDALSALRAGPRARPRPRPC